LGPRTLIKGYPRGSRVVPLDSTGMISYWSLIVSEAVSCTVFEIIIVFDMSNGAIWLPLCFQLPTDRFPWDDLRKILHRCQRMARVQNSAEVLPKISIGWVECTDITDRRQTDGIATAGTRTWLRYVRVKMCHTQYETLTIGSSARLTRGLGCSTLSLTRSLTTGANGSGPVYVKVNGKHFEHL